MFGCMGGEKGLLPQNLMVATLVTQPLTATCTTFRYSVSNRYGTSISEIGEEALDQAEELVEARSKSQC